MTSPEHLDLTDLVAQRALEMRDLREVHIVAEPGFQPRIECEHMFEVEVQVPRELAVTAANVHGIPEVLDVRLA
jgi:hypothetical protein